jgi:hypothetical protein
VHGLPLPAIGLLAWRSSTGCEIGPRTTNICFSFLDVANDESREMFAEFSNCRGQRIQVVSARFVGIFRERHQAGFVKLFHANPLTTSRAVA